jgi:hypothetical protein
MVIHVWVFGRGSLFFGLLYHVWRRIGSEHLFELLAEVARDNASAATEIYDEVLGSSVIFEDRAIQGGRIGWAKRRIGHGVKGSLTAREMLAM